MFGFQTVKVLSKEPHLRAVNEGFIFKPICREAKSLITLCLDADIGLNITSLAFSDIKVALGVPSSSVSLLLLLLLLL